MRYWDMEIMLRHVTITVTLKNKEGKQKNRLQRKIMAVEHLRCFKCAWGAMT